MVVIFAFQSNVPGTFRLFASFSVMLEATCVTIHTVLEKQHTWLLERFLRANLDDLVMYSGVY